MPGQACAIAAGALDPDGSQFAEPTHPGQHCLIAGWRGRERLGAQHPSDLVDHCRDVDFRMGVHAAGNRTDVFGDARHTVSFRSGNGDEATRFAAPGRDNSEAATPGS